MPAASWSPVRTFSDTVLDLGRDRFGGMETPLLASFLEARTRRPWRFPAGGSRPSELVLSNLANQLNFLRVLQGLTVLSGDPAYRERALAICRFALRHTRRRGMLLWGNHAAVDLISKRPAFPGAGFLDAAEALAGRLVQDRYHDGLFTGLDGLAGTDAAEPLAVLHVAARRAGRSAELLPYFTNSAISPLDGWVREEETGPLFTGRKLEEIPA